MLDSLIDYREKFRKIAASSLGKMATVQVKKIVRTDCPDCNYDPIRKESTNPKCPTCGGAGELLDTKLARIPAFVNFYNSNEDVEAPGVVSSNTVRVTVDGRTSFVYRDLLKPRNRVYIDDEVYEITSRFMYGIAQKDMETYHCIKIAEPVEGVV